MKNLMSLIAFVLSTTPALALDIPHVKVIRVHDGDTFTIELPKTYKIFGPSISVRIFGIDTPEMHGILPCEREKAGEAQALANAFLIGHDVTLKNVKHDKYFRLLAEAWVGNDSLSSLMLKKNLAYPYFGKTKEKRNWCVDGK